MSKVKITLVKSLYGRMPAQRATLRALGLKKISASVVQTKSKSVLGMIRSVNHLIKTEDVL